MTGVSLVRYGIPAALIVAGLVLLPVDSGGTGVEAWALFTGAGLAVLLLNLLYRVGVSGDVDRDREEKAREYLAEHGRWPDEEERPARRWRLPEGVATPESEAEEQRRRSHPS